MEVKSGGRISINSVSKCKFTFEIENVQPSDEREYEVLVTSSATKQNVTIASLSKLKVIKKTR